jgi:hypothetical protein
MSIGLNLFHIVVVFPLFLYVAIFRGFVPLWVYQCLVLLGILLLVFHSYLLVTKWKAHSTSVWVNVLHVFFVAPLLIYIGKNAYDTPKWAFELLALSSFAALGQHLYKMVLTVQELKTNPSLVGPQGQQELRLESN